MEYQDIAKIWQAALTLIESPVAIAFINEIPEGVKKTAEPSPSTCTYWRRGQQQLFYADAADHSNCPIGLMTMGFPLTPEQGEKAQSLVGTMAGLHYFDPAEVAHIPGIKKEHQYILYGPLAEFPITPDLLVLLLNPYQSMIATEALGQVAWAENPQLGVFGRPACAALPKATQLQSSTISLGCIGARTYLELPQEEMLLVVPGDKLPAATERLLQVVEANEKLADYHTGQKQAICG